MYAHSTRFTKAAYFYASGQNTAPNVFSETDRAAHAAERRLVSHSLSRRNLLGMQDMINANTQRWVEQLRAAGARDGGWVALWDATRCLTLDTISTFAYGSPEGGLDRPDFKHELFDVFNQIPTIVPAVQNLPFVPRLFKILATFFPKFVESRINEVSLGGLFLHQAKPCFYLVEFSRPDCSCNMFAR